MTWLLHGVGVLLLLGLSVAQVEEPCPYSERIGWIPEEGIVVGSPWNTYQQPEKHCCDQNYPNIIFNAQEKCSLCYNLTKSTPGFAADPNNCQNYIMCEPAGGPDKWNVFPMTCPNCTFWDQDKLTCVQVYYDTDKTGVCGIFTPQDKGITNPPHDDDPKLFCIDFENPDQLADYGVYVLNDGVEVVNDGNCPKIGSQCGHFLGTNVSRLEVPLLSNAYSSYPSLKITMYIKKISGSSGIRGIISNDCGPDGSVSGADGNSLYCSANGDTLAGGLKDPAVDITSDTSGASVIHVTMEWTGSDFSIVVAQGGPSGTVLDTQSVPFAGPIRNSHCPLVIGSFIKEAYDSYFEGYMDDICFYKR